MTKEAFKKGMTLLIAAYPDKDFNTDVFWMMWKDIENEKFLEAIVKFCQTSKEIFPGTNIIACIREIAFGVDEGPLAITAFSVMMAEVSRTGSYGIPKFEDPVLEETVKALGWRTICGSRSEDVAILRAQFTKAYESIKKRKLSDKMTGDAAAIAQNLIGSIGRKQIEQVDKKTDDV